MNINDSEKLNWLKFMVEQQQKKINGKNGYKFFKGNFKGKEIDKK